MATTRPSYTKLTCPSPTTTTKGARGPRFHTTGDEVPHAKDSFARQLKPNGRSTSCASFPHLLLQLPPSSQPEGPTTSLLPQSATDDNGTPATWTLVLSSSKPLTGRTGYYRLRDASVYWNYWRYSLTKGILPLPDKDSSQDDMPCRHPIH